VELTETSQYKNRKVSGYMLNVGLSEVNQQKIAGINRAIKDKFGDVILAQSSDALHITLLDWVAPLVEYGRDRDVLFEEVFPLYDKVLAGLTSQTAAFNIIFDTIKVSSAAIFIQGHDEGQFQSLRDGFVREAGLIPGTKQPPTIVHCTIARFDAEVGIDEIRKFVESMSIHLEQPITGFRLVHETDMPMVSFDLLKTYSLLR
jgi:hypothetical protein